MTENIFGLLYLHSGVGVYRCEHMSVHFYRPLLGMTTSVNLKEVIVDTLSGKAVVREAPAAALSHGFTSTSVRKPAAILR